MLANTTDIPEVPGMAGSRRYRYGIDDRHQWTAHRFRALFQDRQRKPLRRSPGRAIRRPYSGPWVLLSFMIVAVALRDTLPFMAVFER